MVSMKATRSILSRSAGKLGGATNGRPIPWPALRNSIACLSISLCASSEINGTSVNSGFGFVPP